MIFSRVDGLYSQARAQALRFSSRQAVGRPRLGSRFCSQCGRSASERLLEKIVCSLVWKHISDFSPTSDWQ